MHLDEYNIFKVISMTYTIIKGMLRVFSVLLFSVAVGFSCLCSAACVGLRCEQDIDDCNLNACEHTSACKDLYLVSIHEYY